MANNANSKYQERLAKYGAVLHAAQSKVSEIKQTGKVKNWLEAHVLLSKSDKFTKPVPQFEGKHSNNPLVAAGVVVPADYRPNSQRSHEVAAAAVTNKPEFQVFEAPTNVIAHSQRSMYDNALDDMLAKEIVRLEMLKVDPDATNYEVAKQEDVVVQLRQQKEMALQQHENTSTVGSLEERLQEFFKLHDPPALRDGRLERVLFWTKQNSEEKLNSMLRDEYKGKDLHTLNVKDEHASLDQRIKCDKLASRLDCFYRARGIYTMSQQECLKIAEWAVMQANEAALNAKLRAKYQDDLEAYAHRLVSQVEDKLRAFYAEYNPTMMREKGVGPLLAWTVDNGIDALNDLLLDKYGVDLQGRRKRRDNSDDIEV